MTSQSCASIEQFQRALEILAEHAPAEICQPITQAWHKFLASGADFSAALGLTRRARKRFILAERNAYLRRALLLCDGKTTSNKAHRLHIAVEVFRDERWPALRMLPAPPAELAPLQQLLFEVFRLAVYDGVPGTARAIEQICEMHPGVDFEINPAITLVEAAQPIGDTGVANSKTPEPEPEGEKYEHDAVQKGISRHRGPSDQRRPAASKRRRARSGRSGKRA